MKAALAKLADHLVIATWGDDTAAQLPTAPDGCEWVAFTSDTWYATVRDNLWSASGVPMYETYDDGKGLGLKIVARTGLTLTKWFAHLDADSNVIATHCALDGVPPTPPPGMSLAEITEAQYVQIGPQLNFDSVGGRCWKLVSGTLTANVDTRLMLEVSAPEVGADGFVDAGTVVNFSFQAKNADGTLRTDSRSVPLYLITDSNVSTKRLTLTNGTASKALTLAAGHYQLRSGAPVTFKVTGVADIRSIQNF